MVGQKFPISSYFQLLGQRQQHQKLHQQQQHFHQKLQLKCQWLQQIVTQRKQIQLRLHLSNMLQWILQLFQQYQILQPLHQLHKVQQLQQNTQILLQSIWQRSICSLKSLDSTIYFSQLLLPFTCINSLQSYHLYHKQLSFLDQEEYFQHYLSQ